MSSMAIPDQFSLPQNQQLGANPMLPPHPATAALDSQYAADEAVLRANTAKQYADILQQLGYTDDQGNFIPGSVATNAARQNTDLQRSSDIAAETNTQDMQRAGTLFSGYRGTAQARAQYPFQQSMIDLGINVPLTLSQLHEQAAGLVDQYTLQNNQLLAGAAQRAAAGITASGGSGTGTPAGPGAAPAGGIGTAPAAGAAAPMITAHMMGGGPSALTAPMIAANHAAQPSDANNPLLQEAARTGVTAEVHPADIAIAALKAIKPHTAAIDTSGQVARNSF